MNERGERMVAEQLRSAGIRDERVMRVMADLPREEFLPPELAEVAYVDRPLAIGGGQTISQPFVVAAITQALNPRAGDSVLEVGAGSGYQAAVLSRLAARVIGVELVPELARSAAAALARLGIENVQIKQGDGRLGCPAEAPFDCIAVSAAAQRVPQSLLDQLADGGRLAIPVETGQADRQDLLLLTRSGRRIQSRLLFPVRFVPLLGSES